MFQCLKMKLPQFVEKMIFGPNAINRLGLLSNENIFPLLKKPWDPVSSGLVLEKPRKLPGNPIFIVASSFTSATGTQSKYLHKWIKLLNTLAHVITVHGKYIYFCQTAYIKLKIYFYHWFLMYKTLTSRFIVLNHDV